MIWELRFQVYQIVTFFSFFLFILFFRFWRIRHHSIDDENISKIFLFRAKVIKGFSPFGSHRTRQGFVYFSFPPFLLSKVLVSFLPLFSTFSLRTSSLLPLSFLVFSFLLQRLSMSHLLFLFLIGVVPLSFCKLLFLEVISNYLYHFFPF